MSKLSTSNVFRIMIADDDADDRDFIQSALLSIDKNIDSVFTHDGDELMQRLHLRIGTDRLPDVILLDLNMAKKSGIEVLKELRLDNTLCEIPVTILTGSVDPHMIREAYGYGAQGYILKPVSQAGWELLMRELLESWKQIPILPVV